jgi:hypothetical protein
MINKQVQQNAMRQWDELFTTPAVKSLISSMILN